METFDSPRERDTIKSINSEINDIQFGGGTSSVSRGDISSGFRLNLLKCTYVTENEFPRQLQSRPNHELVIPLRYNWDHPLGPVRSTQGIEQEQQHHSNSIRPVHPYILFSSLSAQEVIQPAPRVHPTQMPSPSVTHPECAGGGGKGWHSRTNGQSIRFGSSVASPIFIGPKGGDAHGRRIVTVREEELSRIMK